MRPFSLDDALSSAAGPLRNNEFLTYILETTVPGVHFNVDDDERLLKVTTSAHMLNAGRARIVDGTREDHMIAGYLQNGEGWARGSDKAAMKILDEEGSKGEPSLCSDEEKCFTGGEPGDDVSEGSSHSHYLEFLRRQGPNFLTQNLEDKVTTCSRLLTLAEFVKVLPPANEPLPWDVLDMSLWKASVCELVKEMQTVEEHGRASLMRNFGTVYVLTKSPYPAFLRALAAEIADAAAKN